MVTSILLASTILAAPSSPSSSARPTVEVTVLGPALLMVRSRYPIQDMYRIDPQGHFSFYPEYSSNHREAIVRIGKKWSTFGMAIETGVPGVSIRERHKFVIRHPDRRR